MKLVRHTNPSHEGKFRLIEIQKGNRVEDGFPWTENEFFVLKLKDRHALPALLAYADSVEKKDQEFAEEIRALAARAGKNSPWCKDPD